MNKRAEGRSLEIFYSYARRDESMRNELENHLQILCRNHLIGPWHDRMLSPGSAWSEEIDDHIDSADLILLLVSSYFLASDYAYEKELKRAMARHRAGSARVIPIILRPCRWDATLFGKLQALPRDGKPVSEWRSRHAAFLNVVEGIEQVIRDRAVEDESPASKWVTAMLLRREVVRFVQQFLLTHGFYQGHVDGEPGVKTRDALRAFQVEHGLESDGLIGPETLQIMSRLVERPAQGRTSPT